MGTREQGRSVEEQGAIIRAREMRWAIRRVVCVCVAQLKRPSILRDLLGGAGVG